MTRAPGALTKARAYLINSYGVAPEKVGIVGGPHHAGGYHCGADRTVANDYSVVESSRDRKGLTDAAAALDIGTFSKKVGSRTLNLRSLSVWLVAQCKAGTADTRDIREVIYTDDGKTVKRWDRLGIRTGGDDSHLWHTHISYFRDSESRDKTALFKQYLEGDVSAKDVWHGYFIDKIDKDSGSSSRMRPESYLAWNHEYNKQQLAQNREILAGQAAILGALRGENVEEIQATVAEELAKVAESDRAAADRNDLIVMLTDQVGEMAAAIADAQPGEVDRPALETALKEQLERRLAA